MTMLAFQTDEEIDRAIPEVVRHLAGGGLLLYPTETVYGLGSRPVDRDLARLADLKGRPPGKPFLLLVSGIEMATAVGLEFTPAARVLSREFWPGPLTLVLRGGENQLPAALRGPEGGIAVRHTSHEGVARLIRELGTPLTSTSANRPGEPPTPGVRAIRKTFGPALESGVLLALDAGVLGNVPPSTLIDCTGPQPRIVRDGAITREELSRRAGSYAP